jgi:glutamate synthase (NADPH/NADH) small chain
VPPKVAVLGGGNTAMDAALMARTHGGRDVYLIYRRSFAEMPAWPAERDKALEKGVHFLTLTQPLDYTGHGAKLSGIKVARTTLGEPDKSGRRKPEVLPQSEHVIPVDLVIEALGQNPVRDLDKLFPGLELDDSGFVKVDAGFRTNLPDLYAGGDIVNSGTTVVRAVAEGMKAAMEIIKNAK